MSTWANRITGTGEVDPASLLANPRNWRIHPGEQQEHMSAALKRTGWIRKVIVSRNSGFVVDGHMRVAVSIREGEQRIPVDYVDLTDDEELAILSTFDPLADMAQIDRGKLRNLKMIAMNNGDDLSELLAPILGRQAPKSADASEIVQFETREARMEVYTTTEERQIHLVMTQDEYAMVIRGFSEIAEDQNLDTNRDVLIWLLAQEAQEYAR